MTQVRTAARGLICLALGAIVFAASAANPPAADRGIAWLSAHVQADGTVAGESTSIATAFQARAETLATLKQLATPPAALTTLVTQEPGDSNEYIARQITVLAPLGVNVSASVAALLATQNADGGFGGAAGYQSNALDTAFALLALKASGTGVTTAVTNATAYLTATQSADGSFSINEQPSVYVTSYALQAYDAYALSVPLTLPMQSAKTWLVSRQSAGAYASVMENAVAAIALTGATTDSSTFTGLQSAITSAQAADGSWSAGSAPDPYLTAIAIRALVATGTPPPASTTATLTGVVVDDASGALITGALVQASGPTSVSGNTNASGAFQLAGLAPGAYSVQVSNAGYAPVSQNISASAGVTSNLGTIRLIRSGNTATLQGVVRDGSTNQPVSGVTVAIAGGPSAQTDVTGAYQIAAIAPGSASVSVSKSGYQSIAVTATLSAGATVAFSPSLYANGATIGATSVSLTVVSSATNLPISGATLTAAAATAITDSNGKATLTGLPQGMVTIQASAPGFVSQAVTALIASGANQGPTLALAPVTQSITLSGKVTDSASGAGIGGATVRVQNTSLVATSDSTGRYQLFGIASVQFTVTVAAPGYTGKTAAVTLSQLASSTLDFALDKAQSSGLVVTSTTTDQAIYLPFGEIEVTMTVLNSTASAPTLNFQATVFDPQATPALYTSATPFVVKANDSTEISIDIHNTNQPAGTYSVAVQGVDANGVVQVEGSASFAIGALARISGSVVLDPPVAQAGATQPISINASVSNHGNVLVPAGLLELTITLDAQDPSYSPLGQTTTGPPFASGPPLNRPVGAVYGAQGVLWILNGNDGKIIRVTPQLDGKFVTDVWLDPATLPAPNPFPTPVALTIDALGNLYVLNASTTIVKVDPNKNVTTIATNNSGQVSITSDGANLLYVGLNGNSGSAIFSVDVNTKAVTPVIGSGFSQPAGVAAAPDGTTYVSSTGTNSIVKVSPAGEISVFLSSGLSGPRGIALTSAGDLLIANSGTSTILKASTSSAPTLPLPVYGSGANLASPSVVALGSDGTLYVTNSATNSIVTVPPGGGIAQPFVKSLVTLASGMTYDAAGNLYIVGNAGEVVKVDTAGIISTLASIPSASGVAATSTGLAVSAGAGTLTPVPSNGTDVVTGLQQPSGVASGGGTLVYVAERAANRVSLVDMATKSRTTFADSFVTSGDDLYFAPNGDRYVLNAQHIALVSATSATTLASSGLGFSAQAFVPNPAGGFYLEEGSDLKTISATGIVAALATTPALPISLAPGLALDNSANILVGDRQGRKILRVNPATGAVDTFADLSSFSTSALGTIASDGSGGVFAGISDGKIIRVPSTGGNPSLITTLVPAGFVNPWRLAFDAANGIVYVKTTSDVRSFSLASPGQVTILNIPGGSTGALQFANGLVHVSNGNFEIRSYTPQGVLTSTLAGFNQPQAIAWDGTRLIVADASKTISVVPGQLPQTLADETVLALTLSGGNLYGTRSNVIFTLAPGARTYTSYFANTALGLKTLSSITARPGGGFSFSSRDDQRILTIDASQNVVASYAGVNPTSMAIDSTGSVFIASGFRQITKIDPVTRQSFVYDTNTLSTVLAVFNGQLLAASGGTLFAYAANGTPTQVFTDSAALFSSMVTANGTVYLTDSSQLKVSRWDGSTMTPFASGIAGLSALRYGVDAALYAGASTGALTRISNGKILQLAGDLGNITAVTTGPSGRVFAGSSLGYLTAFDAGTFKRTDLSNLAQLAGFGLGTSPGIQYLTADASEVLAAGIGFPLTEAYRVTYTPPPPPPVAGTIVFRTQASVGDLPVGGNAVNASFGTWPIPFPGDFNFSVHRLDAITGAGVNELHVGPSASGIVTTGATQVPPGTPSVHVTTRVTGGDFASVARVDPSRTTLAAENFSTQVMGADALGRIYTSGGSTVFRTKASGGLESIWISPNGSNGTVRGSIPVDNNQNFYAVAGPSNKEIYGVSATTLQQVSHDTLPEPIISIVRDSQDAIWALTIFLGNSGVQGNLYRLVPGQPAVLVTTAPIRNPFSLAIDGKDNVYVQTSGAIIRVTRDGASSLVVGADAAGEPLFEFEGVAMAGDCADNIFVTPLSWKKYGQGAGWAFPQFEEEHVLIQVNGSTGQVKQVFDGLSLGTDLSDMDGIFYDRFGGQLLVISERWITGGPNVLYRMPVTCGSISTDLHVVVPAGQATSGYSVAPTSIVPRADGSNEIIWSVTDVAIAGKSVSFDTALPGLALGENRPVASEAFLLFQDTFASTPVKVPLAVPSVTADGLVDVGVAVSPSSYPSNTPISGTVTLTSRDASQPHTDSLTITVTDAQGALVTQVAQQSATVAARASVPIPVTFNTGTYLSGSYLVKAVLTDPATGIAISTASAGFDILADATSAVASVSSDKQNYQPIDTVTLDGRAKNVSVNDIASDLTLAVVVRGPSGNVIFSDSRTVSVLVPGALQDAFFQLRLNAATAGMYSAQLTLTDSGGTVLDTRTTTFNVLSTVDTGSGLQGSLAAPRFANAGDAVTLIATLVNRGNAALPAMPVTFRIVNPVTGTAITLPPGIVTLPVGAQQQVSATWDTTGFAAGTYVAAASATFSGRDIALGQANITIGVIQPFSFAPKTNAPVSTLVQSDPITVGGIVAPAAISVTVGEFQIGTNGAWSGSVGTVSPGDVVTVRVTTAATFNTTTTAVLTIAGFSAPFSVTTLNAQFTPGPITFAPVTNVPLGSLQTSNTAPITGIGAPVPISIVGGQYSINGGPWTSAPGTIANGDTVAVRLTAATTLGTTTTATLTVSNVSAVFSVTTTAIDNTPDAFAFTSQSAVPRSTLRTSNTVTITGINVAVPISIVGGTYSVNGGPFTSAPGSIANGNTVTVQQTSSPNFSTTTTAILNVNNVTGSFAVSTEGADISPDAFTFTAQTGVALNAPITSNTVTVRGINTSVPVSVSGGQYSVNTGAFTGAAGTLNPLDTVTVKQTSSSSFATPTTATLTVSDFSAPFLVTTKTVANVTTAPAIAADARVLVLMSCKASDDDNDDTACTQSRTTFIDTYLTTLGVDHKIVTTEDTFKSEFRSGKYSTYWISGGAGKLEDDLAEEVREAGFRGETVIVDGVHDGSNNEIDEALGVVYQGKPSHLDTVTLTGTFLPAGSFNVSGSKAIRVVLTTGVRQAKFNTGDPAIVTNTFGLGQGLLFAFDLAGTLAAQPTSTLLSSMFGQSLDFVAPTVPASFTGGAYMPFSIDLNNTEPVAVNLVVTVTLPSGFSLVATTPAATQTGTQVVWNVAVPAGATLALEGAIRTPDTSATYTLPILVTQTYGTTSVQVGTFTIPVVVKGLDTALPQVISGLQALTLSSHGGDSSARDNAVQSLRNAQTDIGQARWEDAISALVDATDKLDSIDGTDVSSYRATVDNVMKEVERRWWAALPLCPSSSTCRTP